MIQTVDIFPPAVDDPYEYGQIAAANSLSDIWAMGGEAKLCMNILMYPADFPPEAVNAILRGGYEKIMEAGALVVGGHTLQDDIPKYGLSVSGLVHPEKVLRNNTIQKGDVLILTKAIGTGVLINAYKGNLLNKKEYKKVLDSMTMLNKYAADSVKAFDFVHACTDITGFSLIGHSFEMCAGTGLSIEIDHSKIPFLEGALNYASLGLVPAATYANKKHLKKRVSLPENLPVAIEDLLFDPQTSGGLLYSVDAKEADKVFDAVKKTCPQASIIGQVINTGESSVIIV